MADRRVSVQVDADISGFSRALLTAGTEAKAFASELESADGRMANLVQAGLALAPALVPLGAAAVPAVAGLTLQLGLAAGAAGVAVLAFHGVGDSLKALDTYQITPTAANFAKLQAAMDKLGPAGQEFVLALDKMKPQFQGLQDVAEAGLLPGVTDGMHEVIDLMPQVKDVIFTISSTLGDLARDSGKALGGPEMTKFFEYLDSTARPVLTEMGQTLGNVLAGFANMLMAFDPLSRSFSTGLLHMSAAFKTWSEGLSQSQGFHDFVSYVESSGPKALDALGSIADALVQLVEAAAPVGSAVLPIISALADGLSAIAATPVGPVLISAAAAIGLLGRSMALLKAVGLTGSIDGKQGLIGKALGIDSLKGAPAAIREAAAATKELALAEKEAGLAHASYLGSLRASSVKMDLIPSSRGTPDAGTLASADALVAANKRVADSSERVAAAEKGKASAIRGGLSTTGKAVGVAAGLAVATSGLADSTGLSNTASLALMGTIAGPWGAAIGGGVGLVKDFAAANNDLEAAGKAAQAVFASPRSGPSALQGQVDSLSKSLAGYNAQLDQAGKWNSLDVGAAWTSLTDTFTHSSDEQTKHLADMRTQLDQTKSQFKALAVEMGTPLPPGASAEQIQAFADSVAPAMQKAGISVKDFASYGHIGVLQVAADIQQYNKVADSASTKSSAVGKAMADLGNEMAPVASQADALKAALDSLFGVELSQSAATDGWTTSLQALRKSMAGTNGELLSNSKAALAARDATRSYVQASLAKIEADAAADGNGRRAAATLLQTRDNIVATARAAGASKGEIAALVKQMGLTPANMRTIITTPGLLPAKAQVQALARLYNLTPKAVHTLISQAGMAKSQGDIDALAKKYHLTPKEVRTLLTAIDHATTPIERIKAQIAGLHGKQVTVSVAANYGALAAFQAGINNLHGKTVTINTVHASSAAGAAGAAGALGLFLPRSFADGGMDLVNAHQPELAGPGPTRMWREPETMGESYIPHANDARRPRAKAITEATAALFGGDVTWHATGSISRADSLANQLGILNVEQQIRDMSNQLSARNKLVKNKKTGKVTGGGLTTTGLDREVLKYQLEAAKIDLTTAKHKSATDAKAAALQKATDIGAARGSFTSGLAGIVNPQDTTITSQVRDQLATFKAAFKDAGGAWTNGMSKQAVKLVDSAKLIDRETAKRDALSTSLDDQKAALDTLTQTMSSYSDSVASKFLTDPFNGAHTVSTPGVVNPADQARLDALNAQLGTLRNSPGGDSVAAAAAASKLIPQIKTLTDQIALEAQPVDTVVSGLQAMNDQLNASASAADAMSAALSTLASKGLDTTGVFGGLYSSLAASGDFATATQLAALSVAQIDSEEKLYASTTDKAASVAALATQAVYGAQQAVLVGSVAAQTAQLAAANKLMSQTAAVLQVLGQNVETGAQNGTHAAIAPMQKQLADLTATVASQQGAIAAQAGQIVALSRANVGGGRS